MSKFAHFGFESCVWSAHLLEKLMEGIYQTRQAKNYNRLEKTLSFIKVHYPEWIAIERIAKEVCLSPSRNSHIVKDELGITLKTFKEEDF